MLRSVISRLKTFWDELWFVGWAEQEDDEHLDLDPEDVPPGRVIL